MERDEKKFFEWDDEPTVIMPKQKEGESEKPENKKGTFEIPDWDIPNWTWKEW